MAAAMTTHLIFSDNVVNMSWFVYTHQANIKLILFNNIVVRVVK